MNAASDSPPPPPGSIVGVTPADLDLGARIILAGGLVAAPTETVYGLAADALDGRAVARIYAAKGRPEFNPLICHVASLAMANQLAQFSPLADELAARFWPGPLTLVLPRAATCPVSDLATAGLDTIALRMPKHPAIIGLIERVARPLAAPSANASEQLSPVTAQHVASSLGSRVNLILDGGRTTSGIESTIVALTESGAVMLRPGALARAEIEAVAGPLASPSHDSKVVAPGMLRRHYAPRARLRVNALESNAREAYLAFGDTPRGLVATLNLSPRGDLEEAAANLFAMLHELDSSHDAIAVAPIPNVGLGEGINDRLKRAGARHEESGV